MIDSNFQLDWSGVDRGLRRLVRRTPALSRLLLSYISEAIVNRTVGWHLSGRTLKRVTGKLAQSINYRLKGDWISEVGSNLVYAAIHEFGGTIVPRAANALVFKVKDQWVTTQKVTIKARPYISPSIEWVFRHEADDIINRQGQKWIDKEFRE